MSGLLFDDYFTLLTHLGAPVTDAQLSKFTYYTLTQNLVKITKDYLTKGNKINKLIFQFHFYFN